MMNTLSHTTRHENLTQDVREVFVQVTRYPPEILEPDSQLEEDLGIDSVKLGEVFSVLRERYALPEKPDIQRDELRTIASISNALGRYLVHTEAPAPRAITPRGAEASARQVSVGVESFAGLTPALKPFAGKIALVTGSGRGLGKD